MLCSHCHVMGVAVLSGGSLSCQGGGERGGTLLSNALHRQPVQQYPGCSNSDAYTGVLHYRGMLHDALLAVLSATGAKPLQIYCLVDDRPLAHVKHNAAHLVPAPAAVPALLLCMVPYLPANSVDRSVCFSCLSFL